MCLLPDSLVTRALEAIGVADTANEGEQVHSVLSERLLLNVHPDG